MMYKKYILIALLFLACTVGVVFLNKFFSPLGTFIGFFSLSFFAILFVMLFVEKQIFDAWKRFVLIFLPLVSICVLILPSVSEGFVGVDKEMAILFFASLFLASSLGIIIWKSIQLKNSK